MSDILDAISNRLKSAYFGYAALSFIGINWRELFFLVAAERTVLERIEHFDVNTDTCTLFLYPLGIAALLSLLTPWSKLIFGYIAQKPTSMLGTILAKSENKIIIERTEHENSRNLLFSGREQEVLDQAKRDEQLNDINDPDARADAELRLAKIRVEKDGGSDVTSLRSMNTEQIKKQESLANSLMGMSVALANKGMYEQANELKIHAQKIEKYLNN